MQRSLMGVGPALRKARVDRGASLDEASRDTRIRTELLEALEEEDFEVLMGDVYVRGCLRSYSNYLGLDSDKVVSAYTSSLISPPPPATAPPPALEPAIRTSRRRDNQRLALLIAALVLALAAAFGVLSKSRSAPPAADLPTTPPPVEAIGRSITLALEAHQEVEATITVDGVARTITLKPGEGRSFEATTSITVRLSRGGVVSVVVSGKDLGTPGRPGRPWEETFSFGDPEATPSPTG